MVSDNAILKPHRVSSDLQIINCSQANSDFSRQFENITANPHEQSNLFLKQAAMAADSMPTYILDPLFDFYQQGNKTGALILSHCPQEPGIEEIATPQGRSDKQSYISECCLALIGSRLGQIFGYVQIENGALFQNIVPKPGMELEQSSACSLVELQLHTEQHFHPCSPDYLLLYCLRGDPDAATFFASVRELGTRLDKRYRELLFKPLFRSGIDYVFGNTETERGNGPLMSVLYGNQNDPFLRYDQDLMVGVTAEAEAALRALQSALEQITRQAYLKAGDLLILDNRRTVHGRCPFTAKFDGKDRWLQRSKIKRDLDCAGADINQDGRTVLTRFDMRSS